MPQLEMLYHRCTIESGPAAGNTHVQPITGTAIAYNGTCSNCGHPIVNDDYDLRRVIAHLYEHLCED